MQIEFPCPSCDRPIIMPLSEGDYLCNNEQCNCNVRCFINKQDAENFKSTTPSTIPRKIHSFGGYWLVSYKYKQIESYVIKRLSEVVDDNILRMILRGFGYILNAPVTIIEPSVKPQSKDNLRRIDPIKPDEHLSHYCAAIRQYPKSRENCTASVYRIVKEGFTAKEAFQAFCWAGIKKHFTPLMINNVTMGFLAHGEQIDDIEKIEEGIIKVSEATGLSRDELYYFINQDLIKGQKFINVDEVKALSHSIQSLGENNYKSTRQVTEQLFMQEIDALLSGVYKIPKAGSLWEKITHILRRIAKFGGFEYCLLLTSKGDETTGLSVVAYNKKLKLSDIMMDIQMLEICRKRRNIFCIEGSDDRITSTPLYKQVNAALKSAPNVFILCPFNLLETQSGCLLFINRSKEVLERHGKLCSEFTRIFVNRVTRELINHMRRELFMIKTLSAEEERKKYVATTYHALHQSMDSLLSKMEQLEYMGNQDEKNINALIKKAIEFREDITELEKSSDTLYQYIQTGSDKNNCRLDMPFKLEWLLKSVRDKFAMYAKKRDIECIINPPSYVLPPVYWDEEKMKTVFSNLIHNAIKYSHARRTVTVNLRVLEANMCVDIINQGFGIPIEEKESIFDYLERSDLKDPRRPIHGAGLGLYISKEIIKSHKGQIKLTSKKFGKEHSVHELKKPKDWENFVTSFSVTIPMEPCL